jgi:hypothetical protein
VDDPLALKRNLDALSHGLDQLPARLASVTDASESLHRTVEEAAASLGERRSQAEATLVELAETLARTASVEPLETRLQSLGDALRGVTRDTEARLAAFDSALGLPRFEREVLEAAPATLESSRQLAEQSLSTLEAAVEAGQEALARSLEALMDGEAAATAGAEAARVRLAQAADALIQLMEDRQKDAQARLHQSVEALESLRPRLVGTLETVAESDCRTVTAQVLEKTRTLAADVQHRLVSSLHDLEAAMGRLGDESQQTLDDARAERQPIDTAVQELRARLDPMKRAIDALQAAADEVGLSI